MLRRVADYDPVAIARALPEYLFDAIRPGDRVVLKPNWVLEGHQHRPDEWEQLITHPTLITAVLGLVLRRLDGSGRISLVDGPSTEASFRKLLARYPVSAWRNAAEAADVDLDIIDLRDWEWEVRDEVVVRRQRLPGDPRGKTEVDLLDEASEFHRHVRSPRGYYGADYDREETNRAHDGHHNLYSVSRTVLEADVFINLPKLKTHRKAGITACLKNLVGINTYKNYLPHHSEGSPTDGGDQFPRDGARSRLEGPLLAFLKQRLLLDPRVARLLAPLRIVGKRVFGETDRVIRSGNWYGNDTIWRMILDLNKVLMYANPDGTLRPGTMVEAKRYIGIVDAVIAGDGQGPLAPDPVRMGYLIAGTNPVAIDAVCASLMGFDPRRVPSIARAFDVARFPLCSFAPEDITLDEDGRRFALADLSRDHIVTCEPQFGWKGHIERPVHGDMAAH
jgi:uncharacterized protein (DUF362 family)